MDYMKEFLRLHEEWNGKPETIPKMAADNKDALSAAYTPGVAAVSEAARKSGVARILAISI